MKKFTHNIIIGIVFFGIILNLPTCLIAVYNEPTSVNRYNDFRFNLQPSTLVREDASDFSKMPLENLTISQENNLILDKISPLHGKWINMNPSIKPGSRYLHAMAYDSEHGKVILFGGNDGGYDDETWVYDYATNNWTNMNPPARPGGRYGHAMAYDSEHGKIILFGGYDGNRDDETWAYDYTTNNWTNMNPPARPGARYTHAMAYDSEHDKVILFGGNDGGLDGETWTYDYATNNWTNMNPPTRPSGRDRSAMVFDSENEKIILFGGWIAGARSGETWSYDYGTNIWTNMNPPTRPRSRYVHTMGYDSEQGKVILFGGNDGLWDDETWAYDYATNNWINLNPPTRPSARVFSAMVYDSIQDTMVLFGGDDGARDDETWTLKYEFYPTGIFKSKIINLYEIYNVSGGISWSPENQPVGTNLTLQVGFSNTTNDEDFKYSNLYDSSFTFQGVGQYIHYCVCFESDVNLLVSPILNSIEMFFVERSISDDDGTPNNGNGTPVIPGFNILILVGIAGIVSAFLIRKRH
ncbi:MAG: Kelch repeat-containing protein [Promethearchaeota archaeon]